VHGAQLLASAQMMSCGARGCTGKKQYKNILMFTGKNKTNISELTIFHTF